MTRPPLATTIASLMGVLVISPVLAATPEGYSSARAAAEREAIRRYDRAETIGRQAVEKGEAAMRDKDYEQAFSQFKLACDNIPVAQKSAAIRQRALSDFCKAGVKLAEQRITEGRYADAEGTLRTVLGEKYDPKCKDAVVLMARLETPGYFNKTITPKFRGNIEQVKQWLLEADGYYQSGRYDQAFKRCEQVLNVDQYNIAARKMQEKINLARDNYAVSAYNEARSRAMWSVDKSWANPVRKFGQSREGTIIQDPTTSAGTAVIQAKLNRIIIPKLDFKEATIREAVEFLKKKSVDLDTLEPEPSKRGVNIVLKLESATVPGGGGGGAAGAPLDLGGAVIPGLTDAVPGMPAGAAPVAAPAGSGNPADARITIALNNIPLAEALKYVTQLANLKYKVETYAVSIVPIGTPTDVLVTKEYKVRPNFLPTKPIAPGENQLGAGAAADPTKGGGGTSITGRVDAKEFLLSSGVPFPPGSSANYIPSSSRMVVRNTQENLDLVDILIDASGTVAAAQVDIEAKFVEITQNNLKELSFDWLLGQFNVGNQKVFAGGGTPGTGENVNQLDYPFRTQGTFPVTGGNRSGGTAISANAIDALLFGGVGTSNLAPAIGAVAGVFTDPQFQVVIRALNQKKGVDLMSAPRVTTKSGQKAIIEIIREFRYPTEFDPPQIPQSFGGNNGNQNQNQVNPLQGGAGQNNSFPVTPTTPTSFETRNTGVTLEVEPVIGPDGYTIDLSLVPQVVEFEGFINYGSPIQTTTTNILGIPTTNVITENTINQPIFSTRKVTTNVSIFDGQTVVLGGLMREDVQKVEDKTPFFGDLPMIGRLFRSSIDQHLKRNLVIFVSARLISADGQPVNRDEEAEEVVESLSLPEVPAVLPTDSLPLMPK